MKPCTNWLQVVLILLVGGCTNSSSLSVAISMKNWYLEVFLSSYILYEYLINI
jgi:hypothetical protein